MLIGSLDSMMGMGIVCVMGSPDSIIGMGIVYVGRESG